MNVISGKETQEFFKKINNCSQDNIMSIDKKKDKTSLMVNKAVCKTPLKIITVDGGGHTWPGVKNKFIAKKILGLSTAEIDGNKLVVDYFVNNK